MIPLPEYYTGSIRIDDASTFHEEGDFIRRICHRIKRVPVDVHSSELHSLHIEIVVRGNVFFQLIDVEKNRSDAFRGNYLLRTVIFIIFNSVGSLFVLFFACFCFTARRKHTDKQSQDVSNTSLESFKEKCSCVFRQFSNFGSEKNPSLIQVISPAFLYFSFVAAIFSSYDFLEQEPQELPQDISYVVRIKHTIMKKAR